MGGWRIAALVALAGCEIVFPPRGSNPGLDGAVADGADPADGPNPADADRAAPDAPIDASHPPPPPDSAPCLPFACLSPIGQNGTVACALAPNDYCESGVLDALDPYDLCACSGTSMPFLYVVDNGDGTAMVVLVSYGFTDAGLYLDTQMTCYADDGGCGVSPASCPNADVLVWNNIPISPWGNQFTVMDVDCTTPFYYFTHP